MRRRFFISSFAWGACIALLSMGCGDEDRGPVYSDEAAVVAKDLANAATVLEDRLVFPSNLIGTALRSKIAAFQKALKAGQTKEQVENVILVADRQDTAVSTDGTIREDVGNPYGFMRRALSFYEEANNIVILTEPATLEDVFKEFEENGMMDIGPEPTTDPYPGATPQAGSKTEGLTVPMIDLSGKEIYRSGDDVIRLTSAFLSVKANLDVGASIGFFKIKSARMIMDVDAQAELAVAADIITKNFSLPISTDVFAARYPLPPLGVVPMTLSVRVKVGCSVTGGGFHVEGGGGATLKFKGGVDYTHADGLSPIAAGGFDPYLISPSINVTDKKSATMKCFVQPKLELLFFDAVGPIVKAEAYSKLQLSVPPLHVNSYVGVASDIGGTFRVFGKHFGTITYNIYSNEKKLYGVDL